MEFNDSKIVTFIFFYQLYSMAQIYQTLTNSFKKRKQSYSVEGCREALRQQITKLSFYYLSHEH